MIPIYDAGEAAGVLYLAMRYVKGSDLGDLLDAEKRLVPERALELLGPVAEALDAAHARGLVHRDVKPANVLLARGSDAAEHVYLSDFGLTKHVAEGRSLTEPEQLLGTIDYVAPEQIEGEELDGRVDQYALACVLFECLTGAVPYRGDSKMGVLFAHLQQEPPRVTAASSELPGAIDAVVARGLAKRAEGRYASCGELIAQARCALAVGEPAPSAGSGLERPSATLDSPAAEVFVGRERELG